MSTFSLILSDQLYVPWVITFAIWRHKLCCHYHVLYGCSVLLTGPDNHTYHCDLDPLPVHFSDLWLPLPCPISWCQGQQFDFVKQLWKYFTSENKWVISDVSEIKLVIAFEISAYEMLRLIKQAWHCGHLLGQLYNLLFLWKQTDQFSCWVASVEFHSEKFSHVTLMCIYSEVAMESVVSLPCTSDQLDTELDTRLKPFTVHTGQQSGLCHYKFI